MVEASDRKSCVVYRWAFLTGLTVVGLACTISVPVPGLNGNAIATVSFGLGQSGVFSVTANLPVQNSLLVSNVDVPSGGVSVASLSVRDGDVVVTPLEESRVEDPSLTGAFTLGLRVASAASDDPCAEGIDLGELYVWVSSGIALVQPPSLIVEGPALQHLSEGAFALCLEITSDFAATITVNQLSIEFTRGNVVPDEDDDSAEPTQDTTDSNTADDEMQADDSDDGDTPEEDPENNNAAEDVTGNDNLSDDLPPVDDAIDDDVTASPVIVYANLTRDEDQDPDSGFDTINTQPTASGSGNVIAFLSNVDTTGEVDEVPNYEVVLLVNGGRVQVTQTTSTTNLSGNTYDVTHWGPTVSRDGSTVVFGSDGDLLDSGQLTTEQIYAYDVASGEMQQLSLLDTAAGVSTRDIAYAPRISAEGDVIAWIELDVECPIFGCSGPTRLRITDREGNDIQTTVFDDLLYFTDFSLSGDGATLAFVTSRDPVGENSAGADQLFLMTVGSGEVSQISHLSTSSCGTCAVSHHYGSPSLNHDGSRIAVWANDPALQNSEYQVLALLDTTGGLVTVLAERGVDTGVEDDVFSRPHFSGNSAYVAFSTRYAFGYTQRNYRVDIAGAEVLDFGSGDRGIAPSITEDGSSLILSGNGADFLPDQTAANEDYSVEIWSATAP